MRDATGAPALLPDLLPELSLLAFQRRVLSLAEDPTVPLLERLRFLGIVTSNLDELYMVRMVELRAGAIDASDAGISNTDTTRGAARLAAVEREIAELLAAQARCARECLEAAKQLGVSLLAWNDLNDDERHVLEARYLSEIQPDLISHAITLSPGHPLPHLPHLGLFVAVVFRAAPHDRARLAEHELPRDVPRLLDVPGRPGAVIPIEEVLRANVAHLYPAMMIDGAYLFRVTRGGALLLSEDSAADLLGAVALATEQRPHNPAVRVEVEQSMPPHVGDLILDSLRREAVGRDMELTVTAVQVIDGLLDLRCLQTLPIPDVREGAASPHTFSPLPVVTSVTTTQSMFATIRERDLLLHHPFDAFDHSVVRFFVEAAADPQVTAMSATLYRVGNPSPIVEALLTAARAGKRVFAFVELQARFDEEHNVHWARTLERAGGRVVYGLPGLKVHAKAALVTRQEGEAVVRYVHVGTGNYNPRSGRQYTDLSLFSARSELAHDMTVLFDALAVGSALPDGLPGGALVAPYQLLPALLSRIEREIAHAYAGRPSGITIKVNGLADREVVRALYRASQAGVPVELIVRGICILRPGVPGQSTGIRVLSVVGRFLEHSRIYRFTNGGSPDYLIGSSDLRPRNLRRRVELLVPVSDIGLQGRLDGILERYLTDATAWELDANGSYSKRDEVGATAQGAFVDEIVAA